MTHPLWVQIPAKNSGELIGTVWNVLSAGFLI